MDNNKEVNEFMATQTGGHTLTQLHYLAFFGYNTALWGENVATYTEMLEQAGVPKREVKYLINKIIYPMRENLTKVVENVNGIINAEFVKAGKESPISSWEIYKSAANDLNLMKIFAEAYAIRPAETVAALEAVRSGEFRIEEE